jgi:hypothetical protein
MKASRLKTLVVALWGAILLLGGLLGLWFLSSQTIQPVAGLNLPAPAPGTSLQPTPRPSKTPVHAPGIIYLPSATARYATPYPVTASPTFNLPPIQVEYSVTLPAGADPLTGLIPANPDNLNRRPVSVKISTFPREMVRPVQSGLSKADVVYEYYIEDGLTRFIAVFYSQDAEHAGPVRSGRYFDEHIMRMYHASLVYGYADKRVQKHLENSDLLPMLFLERPDTCPPLCGVENRNAEIRLFVNTAGVGAKLSDNSRQPLRASLFASLFAPLSYPTINRIYTHYSVYSYNYWEYDPAQQVYKRFSDLSDATGFAQGEVYTPHIDNLTGAQLTTDNVVVLMVPHNFHNEFDRWDQVFDIALTGTGEAYLFREGRMIPATWLRDRLDQPIQLIDTSNKLIPLKPGVTFYQVINPESGVSQTDTSMEFFFWTPPRRITPTPSPFDFSASPTPTKRKH